MSLEPLWVKKVHETLKHDFRVDLSGENIVNISLFPKTSTLKYLNLSYVQLQSLAGMKPQTSLQTFVAEGSALTSFAGFAAFSGISSCTLRNSVVEQNPNFALSLLTVCPRVTTLDGKLVKQSVVRQAEKLRELEYTVELVNRGWIAKYPINDEELEDLAKEYGIIEEDNGSQNEENADFIKDDFDQQLRRIDEEHARIVEEAKRSCGFAVPDENEEYSQDHEETSDDDYVSIEVPEYTLLDRIATILAYAGQKIDNKNLKESVLKVIENLCENHLEKVTLDDEDFAGLSDDSAQDLGEEEEISEEDNEENTDDEHKHEEEEKKETNEEEEKKETKEEEKKETNEEEEKKESNEEEEKKETKEEEEKKESNEEEEKKETNEEEEVEIGVN